VLIDVENVYHGQCLYHGEYVAIEVEDKIPGDMCAAYINLSHTAHVGCYIVTRIEVEDVRVYLWRGAILGNQRGAGARFCQSSKKARRQRPDRLRYIWGSAGRKWMPYIKWSKLFKEHGLLFTVVFGGC
jgi:hypothetical protein